jgi:hypothetical protein
MPVPWIKKEIISDMSAPRDLAINGQKEKITKKKFNPRIKVKNGIKSKLYKVLNKYTLPK